MRCRVVELLIASALGGAAPVWGQALDVSLPSGRLTVGDPVDLVYTIRLPAGAALIDSVPQLVEQLPPDVTLNRADPVRVRGAAWVGRMRLTLVRTGLQNLPVFFVRYRRSPGAVAVNAVESPPLPITIASVLPPGRPEARDVRPLEPLGAADRLLWWPTVPAIAAALALLVWRHCRARSRAAAPVPVAPAALASDPYQRALVRLAEVEAAAWPVHGAVDRHYDLVAEVVRRFLVEAAGIDALERTTAELVRLLPPPLAAAHGYRRLLDEADLVKFARARPDAARAAAYLAAVRSLLFRWHEVLEGADAFR